MQLSGEAALRAGGGKLQVVTTESVAAQMAVSIPEALVARAAEGPSGDIAEDAADQVVELADAATAVLLGPGMTSPDAADALLSTVVARLAHQAVVVDALGSACLTRDHSRLHHFESSAVLTLNPTEAAITLGEHEKAVVDDPPAAAMRLARRTRPSCSSADRRSTSPTRPVRLGWWTRAARASVSPGRATSRQASSQASSPAARSRRRPPSGGPGCTAARVRCSRTASVRSASWPASCRTPCPGCSSRRAGELPSCQRLNRLRPIEALTTRHEEVA
jgi:hypothetical protein